VDAHVAPPSPLWSSPPPALSDPYAASALEDERIERRAKPRRGGKIAAIVVLLIMLGASVAGGVLAWKRWGGMLHRQPIATRPTATAKATSPPPPASSAATVTATATPTATAAAAATATATSPTIPTPPPASASSGTSDTQGTLKTSRSAAGHRVFVDGKTVGQGQGSFRVPCGEHTVKIGSSGLAQTLKVPCGGEVSAK
jgi:cytoskeletal protein RodZ